jgi:hypothetical protein
MKMEVFPDKNGGWAFRVENVAGQPAAESVGLASFDEAAELAMEEMRLEIASVKNEARWARQGHVVDPLVGLSPRARACLSRRGLPASTTTVNEIAAALETGKFDEFKDRDEIAQWVAERQGVTLRAR